MAYQCVEVITNLTDVTCNTIEEFYENVYYGGLNKQLAVDILLNKCLELGATTDIIAAIESYSNNPNVVEELDIANQKLTRTKTYPDKFTHDVMHEWVDIAFLPLQTQIKYSVEKISEGEVV